jgi:acyl dehydratase
MKSPPDITLSKSVSEFLLQTQAEIGETRKSEWLLIDQDMIDSFAEVTRDEQFIHIDPKRAAVTPFGGTIAHGFLVLSLLSYLMSPDSPPKGIKMGVNYGFDRIRFIAPVRSGSRIRSVSELKAVDEKKPGQFEYIHDVLIEIEGLDRPALQARWITQAFF